MQDRPMTDSVQVRIIIVEDHEFTRTGLKLSLEQVPGFAVVGEATDGKSGVAVAAQTRPDVVLMDIELPVMDGIEATREIKGAIPESKVLVLTSHSSDQEIFAALGAGAHGYCLKTVSSQQLATAIQAVAEGAGWLDPAIANRVLGAYGGSRPPAGPLKGKNRSGANTPLSPREVEVLRLVSAGLSNQQIAERLGLGLETVKTHMRHIMEKLVVSDRTEAAVKAMREGLM